MKTEQIVNNVFAALFLILGIGALVGVFFYGAYWHYYTAIVCGGMSALLFKTKY